MKKTEPVKADEFFNKLTGRLKIPGGEILTYDEVQRWPPGVREDLEKRGKVRRIENTEEVICDQCGEGCPIVPDVFECPDTGIPIGVYVCHEDPEIGRFTVNLDRRMRWEIVGDKRSQEPEVRSRKETAAGGQKDQWITFAKTAELLAVSKGTVSKWAAAGRFKDNGLKGQKRKLLKSSVLLVKQEMEDIDLRNDARELRQDSLKLR